MNHKRSTCSIHVIIVAALGVASTVLPANAAPAGEISIDIDGGAVIKADQRLATILGSGQFARKQLSNLKVSIYLPSETLRECLSTYRKKGFNLFGTGTIPRDPKSYSAFKIELSNAECRGKHLGNVNVNTYTTVSARIGTQRHKLTTTTTASWVHRTMDIFRMNHNVNFPPYSTVSWRSQIAFLISEQDSQNAATIALEDASGSRLASGKCPATKGRPSYKGRLDRRCVLRLQLAYEDIGRRMANIRGTFDGATLIVTYTDKTSKKTTFRAKQ